MKSTLMGGPTRNGEANGLKRSQGIPMSLNPKVFQKLPSKLNKNDKLILKTWIRGKQKEGIYMKH